MQGSPGFFDLQGLLWLGHPPWVQPPPPQSHFSTLPTHSTDDFVWCSVPLSAQDAFLFVGLALLVMSTLFGKLSAVWVLIAGTQAPVGRGGSMPPVPAPG